ncbi:hypothetical protein ACYPKM_01910 [Pseudomonas aeruginosa]
MSKMTYQDVENTLARLAAANILGEGERQSLRVARDVFAILRGFHNVPAETPAAGIAEAVYAIQAQAVQA